MGKGEVMSKRNRTGENKLLLDEASKLLIRLDRVAQSGTKGAEAARSLSMWYLQHQSWTDKQWAYAKSVCGRAEGKRKAPRKGSKKFHLYAITDDVFIKLGYSSNIPNRVKSMQTGCPGVLRVLWKYYVGSQENDAKKAEKKLHRRCKEYSQRGEWFSKECMPMVEEFTLTKKMKRDFGIEAEELEALLEAREQV